jgi:hypothetical protein
MSALSGGKDGMYFRKNSGSAGNQGDGTRRNRVVALAEIILFILGLAAVVFVVFILWLMTQT